MWAFLVLVFIGVAFVDSWLSNRYLAKRIAELEDKPWL